MLDGAGKPPITCLACLANTGRHGPYHVVTTGEVVTHRAPAGEAITHGAWLTATGNLLALCDFDEDLRIYFDARYLDPFACVALTPTGERALATAKVRWRGTNEARG